MPGTDISSGHVIIRPARRLLASLALALCTLPVLASPARATMTWSGPPIAASTATAQACADLLFVGVRGSAEPAPYGPTVTAVRDELARRTSDAPGDASLLVREVFLDYPAVSPETLGATGADRLLFDPEMPPTQFFDSVRAGRGDLIDLLADSGRRCPGERWVIAGFSQGAQVVTEALADRAVREDADDRLLGAVLLGNPANGPASQGTNLAGDARPDAMGLSTSLHYIRARIAGARQPDDAGGLGGALRAVVELSEGPLDAALAERVLRSRGLAIDPVIAGRITQVCRAGDLICDSGPGLGRIVFAQAPLQDEVDRAQPIHLGYAELLEPAVRPTVDAVRGWAPSVHRAVPFWQRPEVPLAGAILLALVGTGAVVLVRRRTDRARPAGDSQADPTTGSGDRM